MIAGVDEAGRGPVIGPLVIACVSVDPSGVGRLLEIGVRDSKRLSPDRREELFEEISSIARVRVLVVGPREVDRAVETEGLDSMEARLFARLIEESGADLAFVDAPARRPITFARRLFSELRRPVVVFLEAEADSKYPVVAAASIAAKVVRDREVGKLREEYGDFGSGYPGDPKTRRFLEALASRGEAPPIVRRSWSTWRRLRQRTLEGARPEDSE